MLKITPIQNTDHGETELLPIKSLGSGVVVTETYSVHYQRRNINTNLGTNSLTYSAVLPARYARAMEGQNLWE